VTAGYSTLTSEDVRREITDIRRVAKKITKSRASARAFLLKAGIITKNGKLAARYRSKG
jgi:hypothetical protein